MKPDNKQLVGYSDADFAGVLNDRYSTTGNIILLSNGALSWLSKKQQIVHKLEAVWQLSKNIVALSQLSLQIRSIPRSSLVVIVWYVSY